MDYENEAGKDMNPTLRSYKRKLGKWWDNELDMK